MGRLLAFLYAWRGAIWFLLIQGVSVLLLASYNSRHQLVFNAFSRDITGSIQRMNTQMDNYFNLGKDNRDLMSENINLRKQIFRLQQEVDAYKYRIPLSHQFRIIADSLLPNEEYRFIPCKAIYNTISSNYNYIKLDVGRKDGAREGMGVISEDGVVGMVVSVSENYSLAMSLLNTRMRLNAVVSGRGIQGTFRWRGGTARFGHLEDIPLHFNLQENDLVTTSAYSSIFPPGYVIGTVTEIRDNKPNGFYEISVKLHTDFYRLNYLYLIENRRRDELENLTPQQP
ncbi:MAG: rod shape-determining protein MreC [Bacteroidetes bacterium]|nr:rod shape-determining protein MreC [Bacteroidota bacterium]